MRRGFFRGHPIIYEGEYPEGRWVYEDTHEHASFDGVVRPCKRCGRTFQGSNEGDADLCLGELPGVDNACCGHGVREEAYIRFVNGVTVRGFMVEEPK